MSGIKTRFSLQFLKLTLKHASEALVNRIPPQGLLSPIKNNTKAHQLIVLWTLWQLINHYHQTIYCSEFYERGGTTNRKAHAIIFETLIKKQKNKASFFVKKCSLHSKLEKKLTVS